VYGVRSSGRVAGIVEEVVKVVVVVVVAAAAAKVR